ncbi:MAG: phosphodiester glycosidase family protein [Flavobacteriales bacterium]
MKTIFLSILLIGLFSSCGGGKASAQDTTTVDYSDWVTLTKGMEYREIDAPTKSFIGDSKISILRLDRQLFDFNIYSASKYDSMPRDLHAWADTFQLNVVFNAGMYSLTNPLSSRAYLKTGFHVNNGTLLENFNLMLAMNPTVKHRNEVEILDLTCENFNEMNGEFMSYAQGLRMIDCNGSPMYWKKKIQSCSMIIAAEGGDGKFYLIFCRSPYTHNQMIDFMIGMPYHLRNAIYLEGGPETSLLIDVNGHCIEKVGSWVSGTWESDKNNHFWRLPNVVGIKKSTVSPPKQ